MADALEAVELALALEESTKALYLDAYLAEINGQPEKGLRSLNEYFRLRSQPGADVAPREPTFKALIAYLQISEPEHATVLYFRGLESAKDSDYGRAIGLLSAALDIAKTRERKVKIQTKRGWLYLENKAADAALSDFRESIRRDPRHGDAYVGRGLCLALLGDVDGVDDAETALDLDDDKNRRTYFNAALVYAVASGTANLDTRSDYVKRAIELLRMSFLKTLDVSAKESEALFETIKDAPNLRFIHETREFIELAQEIVERLAAANEQTTVGR